MTALEFHQRVTEELKTYKNKDWRFMRSGFLSFFKDMTDIFIEEQKDDPKHEFIDEYYGWGRKI